MDAMAEALVPLLVESSCRFVTDETTDDVGGVGGGGAGPKPGCEVSATPATATPVLARLELSTDTNAVAPAPTLMAFSDVPSDDAAAVEDVITVKATLMPPPPCIKWRPPGGVSAVTLSTVMAYCCTLNTDATEDTNAACTGPVNWSTVTP